MDWRKIVGVNCMDRLSNKVVLTSKGEKIVMLKIIRKKEQYWTLREKRLSDEKCNGGNNK